MNRPCMITLFFLSGVTLCGCGDDKKKPTVPEDKREEQVKDTRRAEFEKAIKEKLATKPSALKVSVVELDAIRDNPIDVVHVALEYEKEKNLGYEGLRFEAMHQIGKNRFPRTSVMAIRLEGEKEVKIVTVAFDDDGKEAHVQPFESDKEKLASVKERCIEIKDALVKALPKEPRKR